MLCSMSRDLLADVRQAVRHSPSPPPTGLLPTLQQLLPEALTHDQLSELSPEVGGQTSGLCLYGQLEQTNFLLHSLHASLDWIQQHSSHHNMFSWRAAQAVVEISDDKIPELWRDILPPHLSSLPSLLTVVRLLWGSLDYLIHTARSGWSLPVELHPLWVFNPTDLMSRVQHWYAEQLEISPAQVSLLALVSGEHCLYL